MAKYNLNEALKARAAKQNQTAAADQEMHLDDVSRVKVLSPGRQVFKRFIRNRLAVFGSATLIVMFVFSFLGPLFYPYGQKQIFYRFESQNVNYALAKVNTNYNGSVLDPDIEIPREVSNSMNSLIKQMAADGTKAGYMVSDGQGYAVTEQIPGVYVLSEADLGQVCTYGNSVVTIGTYDSIKKSITYTGEEVEGLEAALASQPIKGKGTTIEFGGATYTLEKTVGKSYAITMASDGFHYTGTPMGEDFEKAVDAAAAGDGTFEYEGIPYAIAGDAKSSAVYTVGDTSEAQIWSNYTMDFFTAGQKASDEFRAGALKAAGESGSFEADGRTWKITDNNGVYIITDDTGAEYAELTLFSIRRYSGEDTMEYSLKKAIAETVQEMLESGEKTAALVYDLPMQGEDGKYLRNEDGTLQYTETEMRLTQRNTGEYVINADQINYVIDMFSAPSAKHFLGTDGDGFDVLARIMYGGRVSLMVGFVVVFLEILLGVIMGGIAGFYGGWVDNLIMRLVDIFYCLPSMPIMIILGTVMDALRMDTYIRLMIMMAALGIMGWAGVARLVRGQILSLREQEFMVAAEATGIKVRDRIFRHLVPNVMPQLIVTATMGVGSVILTESTLSFLGLGVKHPLATWGTIINSVSSASAMAHYAFIWIPVGLLICLTVIAFNFVGDGLRDAYDPKAKR